LEVNEYTQLVGAIITNLQALETVLRYHSLGPKAREVQFPTLGALDVVENDLTSWVSLGKLVKRFNSSLKPDEQPFKVDSQVVISRCLRPWPPSDDQRKAPPHAVEIRSAGERPRPGRILQGADGRVAHRD
jgi:hypothetical protein